MYMLKAREKLQRLEREEIDDRAMDRQMDSVGGLRIVRGAVSTEIPEDGPPGVKRKVKYIGSFKLHPPPGLSGKSLNAIISDQVTTTLSSINPKRISNTISGNLVINRYGVRIFKKDKSLFMAYPIKQLLFCHASAKHAVVGMVTRTPRHEPEEKVYCHVLGVADAERASQLSQLFAHAFKLAYAHKELRRSLKGRDPTTSDVDLKASRRPWDILKPGKSSKKSKSASALPPDHSKSPPPSLSSSPPHQDHSTEHLPLTPEGASFAEAGASGQGHTPFQNRRHSSISSSDVSVDGLQMAIVRLQHAIQQTESTLQSLPPTSGSALDLTIQLSAYEDQLQVKKQQLATLLEMSRDSPPPYTPEVVSGAGPINPEDESALQDAEWYQAGLPREVVMDILYHEPPGSFIVRDSGSNPGCLAMSVKTPDSRILHYLIVKERQGYAIQGSGNYHPSLMSLIMYHATCVDHLPCMLTLGATNLLTSKHHNGGEAGASTPTLDDSDDSDMDDEEMFEQLAHLNLLQP